MQGPIDATVRLKLKISNDTIFSFSIFNEVDCIKRNLGVYSSLNPIEDWLQQRMWLLDSTSIVRHRFRNELVCKDL